MRNVLEYLEQSAGLYPDKTAVAFRDDRYSFAQLRSAAQSIGAAIQKTGLQHQPIGVVVERSIHTIALFLGVLYSGNFYVPLDPDMPAQKLGAVIADAGFTLICGHGDFTAPLRAAGYEGRCFADGDAEPASCPIPQITDDEPLYVVYTSGSTGKPKGVLKSHRAEICYIEAFCDTFGLDASEVIGNQTPFFFDASGKDIYMMLKLGCTMEILPSTLFALPTELIDYLNVKQVTYASWVPTVLSLVAQLNPFSYIKPTTLRNVFFVGEVMPVKHLNKWRQALPDIRYVNLYGQSEIAGISCYYEVTETLDPASSLPMGVPLKNCSIYLLDNGEIVREPDRIGEMYLVSDALALEYYHDAEKTAAAFIRKDFGSGPVRCFKTGDLARYDSQGNLVFASRSDFQIKHMGHRIELGEIECTAGALPEIARCCCLYNSDKRRITLFCQLSEGAACTGRELQDQLRPRLSSYMLPGKVIILDQLPLNANGKIDRASLKSLL